MKRYIFSLLFTLFSIFVCYGQMEVFFGEGKDFKSSIYPKNPTVGDMGRYNNKGDVDLFRGKLNYDIPLHSLVYKDLIVPISLSYTNIMTIEFSLVTRERNLVAKLNFKIEIIQ